MIIAFLMLAGPAVPARQITLSPATSHIRTSVRVKRGVYTLASKAGEAALQIDADGVTVDFQGATLQSPATAGGRQDAYDGIGIAINGHRNVTVRNAVVHGYQYNIKALKCSGLRLENCEVGQSRSQKIMDGDSVNYIWLVIRDLGVWRTYGSGAWLEDCTGSTVRGVRANQCQNGLMLVNSNNNKVVDCDLGYDSGWGLAMWNSSDNLICWNVADFVNRPWSGFWGGDSAGFVLTTGCNRNVFAQNSLTHGGDGFFQANNCDNNVVAYNDGSWSPHNAFESTFAVGNVFYRNTANASDYGFWPSYGEKTLLFENVVNDNHGGGMWHDQGSDNWFVNNTITNTGGPGIHIGSGLDPQSLKVPSARNYIVGNKITKARRAIDLPNSVDYHAAGNIVRDAPMPADFHPLPVTAPVPVVRVPRLAEIKALKPRRFTLYRETDRPKGWDWLAPTAYGMQDYRKMLVPWMIQDSKTLKLAVNPDRVKSIILPNWIYRRKASAPNEWLASIKPGGKPTGAYRDFKIVAVGKSGERQTIAGRFLDADWHVRWFKWFRNDPTAYTDTGAWTALFAGPALREEDLPVLPNIQGFTVPAPGVPAYYFALAATTHIKFEAGNYRFNTLSDDGIRVLVDGKPVVDNWTHHAGTNDSGVASLTSGLHEIEVRYCQEDGAAALSVHWTKEKG